MFLFPQVHILYYILDKWFVQIYLNVSYEQDIHMSFIHNEEMKLIKF